MSSTPKCDVFGKRCKCCYPEGAAPHFKKDSCCMYCEADPSGLVLLCTILKREFPLMSSRRLPFMTADMVVEVLLKDNLKGCEGLQESVADYVAWAKADFDPELDPGRKYE